MTTKTESPTARYQRLLTHLRHLQMYNRMDAQGLRNGRAAAIKIGAELRAAAAEIKRRKRARSQ